MSREPKPRRAFAEHRILEVAGEIIREPSRRRADAALDEEKMRKPLVRERVDHLQRRKQHERAQRVARAGEHAVVEVRRAGQREVVLGDGTASAAT